MKANICPYLGLINDPNTSTTFPDANNACHQVKPPALITLDYQNNTCLQAVHKECQGYISAWGNGLPKAILRRKSIINPAAIARLTWLLVAIPVILFFWAGFSGHLSFLSLDFRLRSANTPTAYPFSTRTPTATFTHTVALTATESPPPQTETLTPTQTLTRTATLTSTETPVPTITQFLGILPTSTPVSTNPPSQPPTGPPPEEPTQPPTEPPVPTQTPVTPSPTVPPPPTPTQTPSPPPDMRPTNTPER